MPSYQKVLKEVLKQIKPTKEQRKKLEGLAKKALQVTKKEAKKYKAKAMLAGSITRDTWLPGKNEFDVFVLFPEKMKEKKMEELGLKIGKSVVNKLKGEFKIEYAEHPYVSGKIEGIRVDIVPCFEIPSTEKLKSAVDRTPFHVRYIEKKLPLKLSNDVRLLKQFMKVSGVYGADAKVEGFSGYLCELLVINYKSFLNVLKAAVNWKPGEVIDIEEFYPKPDHDKLRRDFKNQVLIMIDPTDKTRNVSAALSVKNFFKFKKVAKEFLDECTAELFFDKKILPITHHELIELQKQRGTEFLIIRFIPPKVVPDILWPQLRKFAERLQSILEETKYEFKVLGKAVFTDENFIATVLLEMEIYKLPIIQKRMGPSVFDKKDAENFLKKYKDQAIIGPYIEDNFWVTEIKRQFLTTKDKLQDSLNKPLDILKAKGIPNSIAERIVNGFEILSDADRIMQTVERNEDFGIFLRKYFEKERLV